MLKPKRVLVSCFEKGESLTKLVNGLAAYDVEFLATGGTAQFLEALGHCVQKVEEYTEKPELLEGRVKTLHPNIFAGILALRESQIHLEELSQYKIGLIDMVVVDLYPFERIVSNPEGVNLANALEHIDIGGVALMRAAAKNFGSVAIVPDKAFYDQVSEDMKAFNGHISDGLLKRMAGMAFLKTACYDFAISSFMSPRQQLKNDLGAMAGNLVSNLRYGENPHQEGRLYRAFSEVSLKSAGYSMANSVQLSGKELSYNNILDCDGILRMFLEFEEPACIIVKHGIPCGIAVGKEKKDTGAIFLNALKCDRLSAFGGIVGFNRAITKRCAKLLVEELFLDCILAPDYEDGALEILSTKKRLIVLKVKGLMYIKTIRSALSDSFDARTLLGGFITTQRDLHEIKDSELEMVTKKKPSKKERIDMLFAWKILKHIRSNAILIVKNKTILGIGSGQTSRVEAVRIAVTRAEKNKAKGAVLASDAFFPMPDGIEEAAWAQISAVIQPGGSIKDKDVIEACDRLKLSMCFTGVRCFKH